jgi:hypothetical protein
MKRVAHPGSWWAQPTREAFAAAHAEQLPRILVEGQNNTVARAVDAMVTAKWNTKFSKPRPLSGVAL